MNTCETPITQSPILQSRNNGMSLVSAPRMRRDGAAPLIGSSAVMRAVRDRIERVAATDFVALIDGESGTGKELVARQIHEISARRRGPFVPVNCAALVETLLEAELFGIEDRTATGVRGRRGKFECADGGTLFLDEVADLSLSAQAKLLRALQDFAVERVGGHGLHRVNTRVVAATNKKLAGARGSAAVPSRPVLPARRHRDPGAAAARTSRGHSRARIVLSRAARRRASTHAIKRRLRRAAHLRLAGERPRARTHDGAYARARRRAPRSTSTICPFASATVSAMCCCRR